MSPLCCNWSEFVSWARKELVSLLTQRSVRSGGRSDKVMVATRNETQGNGNFIGKVGILLFFTVSSGLLLRIGLGEKRKGRLKFE